MKNKYRKISFRKACKLYEKRAGHIVPRMTAGARNAMATALTVLYGLAGYNLEACVDKAEESARDLLSGCDAAVEFKRYGKGLSGNARLIVVLEPSDFDWYVVDDE
ncbi:MAG: hypothetical protein NZM12_11705 [Steroidobacteraceae bacterium]|nr:hypothetical protein [Steroidobacteraceae bacterium]MDW8259513.1 hypothetical protein [Gammaproteobacteria bacterium]